MMRYSFTISEETDNGTAFARLQVSSAVVVVVVVQQYLTTNTVSNGD